MLYNLKDLKSNDEGYLREVYASLLKTACFTGHRPDKLGGYSEDNPTIVKLTDKLHVVIEHLIEHEGITQFISGGALGTDTLAFLTVNELKKKHPEIRNILAVPFKKQSAMWKDNDVYRYIEMLNTADEIIHVDTLDKYSVPNTVEGEYHIAKMQQRNRFMVDCSSLIVSVYDGSTGGTHNCVTYARKAGLTIFNLDPKNNFCLEKKPGKLR